MIKKNIVKLNWLRQLYLEDLSKIVIYGDKTRPRVKYPGKWAKLENVVVLKDGITEPLIIPPMEQNRKVWTWSDTHFFHKSIIKFCDRPYENPEQMNKYLIINYNDCVGENDICIWVGDFGFKGTTKLNELLEQCNGYKILIVGNHDFKKKTLRKLNFDETHLIYTANYPDVDLVFTHYPMANIPWPWVNIHGHSHNSETGHLLHINVSCDVQEYKPKLLDDIVMQAKKRVIAAKI